MKSRCRWGEVEITPGLTLSSQHSTAETRAKEPGKETKPATAKGRWDMSGDHVATAQLMWVFGQEEVGAGGNELRAAEVAAADAGGEQGTPTTHPLQALGMACPELNCPLGQFWVRVHTWPTAGQEGMEGQAGSTVIENSCELRGWTGIGGHGMRMGLSQQRTLHSKELGSLVGVTSLRSPWALQDPLESKMSLFLLWVAQCHSRPVACV